jgi:hypothetical protein
MGYDRLRSRWKLYGIVALVALAFLGATVTIGDRSPTVQSISVDGRNLRIPTQYLRDDEPPLWLRMLPGLDDGSREVSIVIQAEELARTIPAYVIRDGNLRHDLFARLVILTDVEQGRYLNPERFSDVWSSTGSYSNRVVERDPDLGLVRVYRGIEYPRSWAVFTVHPDDTPIPSNVHAVWYGQCLLMNCPECERDMRVSCHTDVVHEGLAIDFYLDGQNIHLTPEIRSYLSTLLQQWSE